MDTLNQKLYDAFKRRNLSLWRKYLEKGADIEIVFYQAFKEGLNEEDLDFFVDNGGGFEIINSQDDKGNTILHKTSIKNLQFAENLVRRYGADVNIKNNDGDTPLHTAIVKGNYDFAQILVVYLHADINAINNKGETALHLVLKNLVSKCDNKLIHDIKDNKGNLVFYRTVSNIEILYDLISEGANIHIKDNEGNSALHVAASSGIIKLIQAKIKDTDYYDKKSLYNILRILVWRNTDINAKNKNGDTPLLLAVYRKREATVELLISAGANVNVKNKDGNTALYVAASEGDLKTVEILVLQGRAEMNLKNKNGNTALHMAVYHKDYFVVKFLVEQGADVNIENDKDQKPLDLADPHRDTGIINILQSVRNEKIIPVRHSLNNTRCTFVFTRGPNIGSRCNDLAVGTVDGTLSTARCKHCMRRKM